MLQILVISAVLGRGREVSRRSPVLGSLTRASSHPWCFSQPSNKPCPPKDKRHPWEQQSREIWCLGAPSRIVELCFQHRAWPQVHFKPFKGVLQCVHLEHAKQTNTSHPGVVQNSALTAWRPAAQHSILPCNFPASINFSWRSICWDMEGLWSIADKSCNICKEQPSWRTKLLTCLRNRQRVL